MTPVPPPPSEKRPGTYSHHVPLDREGPDETTQEVFLRAVAALDARDAHRVLKMSSRPSARGASIAAYVVPIVVAAILAAGSAMLLMWRGDAVADSQQQTINRRVDQVEAAERDHERTGEHPNVERAISHLSTQIQGIDARMERIERQLDARTRPR